MILLLCFHCSHFSLYQSDHSDLVRHADSHYPSSLCTFASGPLQVPHCGLFPSTFESSDRCNQYSAKVENAVSSLSHYSSAPLILANTIQKTCHFCAASHNKVNIASLGVPTVADYFINWYVFTCRSYFLHLPSVASLLTLLQFGMR